MASRYDILFQPVAIGPVTALVMVTERIPNDALYHSSSRRSRKANLIHYG